MTRPMEPTLVAKPMAVLLRRLETEFGKAAQPRALPAGEAAERPEGLSKYRTAVDANLERLFGCPAPHGLSPLTDTAAALGIEPADFALFIGRQFRLKPLRPYSNSSS